MATYSQASVDRVQFFNGAPSIPVNGRTTILTANASGNVVTRVKGSVQLGDPLSFGWANTSVDFLSATFSHLVQSQGGPQYRVASRHNGVTTLGTFAASISTPHFYAVGAICDFDLIIPPGYILQIQNGASIITLTVRYQFVRIETTIG